MAELKEATSSIHPFIYPKKKKTSRDHELLDSIYSDEFPDQETDELRFSENFWSSREKKPSSSDGFHLKAKLKWFTSGVLIASVVWCTYHQIDVNSIKANEGTKIVFQTAASIVTDKTFDERITKNLQREDITLAKVNNRENKSWIPLISSFFAKEGETKQNTETTDSSENAEPKDLPETYHVIKNGDSLWLIAKEYYGEPTPENIKKIMEANKMNRIGYLRPGSKITIPL